MPFYDEYGHAIITPKTRTTYQASDVEPTQPVPNAPTTPRRSSRTRGGIKRGKTTTTTQPIAPVIQDFKKGITPAERQVIDQVLTTPSPRRSDRTRGGIQKGRTRAQEMPLSKHEGIEKLYLGPSDQALEVSGQYRSASKQLKNIFASPTQLQTVTDTSGKTQHFPSSMLLYTIPTDSGMKTVPYPVARGWAEQTSKEYEHTSTSLSSTSFDLLKQGLEAKREWHPDTKVIRTAKGYDVKFPYAGGESYGSYKRGLDKAGYFGYLATAFTPEDPLSIPSAYYTFTGEKQKAIDVKIKAMHRTTVIKEAGGIPSFEFAKFWLESPATQIGMAVVGGYGIGKVGTYAAGRVSSNLLATRALQIGGVAIGSALVIPAGMDIHSTWERGDTGEAVGKLGMLGIQLGAGYGGYRTGQTSTTGFFGKGKGLTAFEIGAKKSYVSSLRSGMKTGDIDILQGARGIRASQAYFKIKADIRLSNLKPFQAEPSFTNIQTLEKTPGLRNWFKQHSVHRRSEIFGGAASEKTSTHDIDIMYRSALGNVETGYASTKLGYGDVSQYADIKMWQRPGSIVTKFGTPKLSSYKHPSGLRTGQFTEQFFRLSESSFNLAHSGRAKDIPGAIRMLDLVYGRTGGVPGRMSPTVESYQFAMGGLEKTPIIMKPSLSAKIYGPGLGKKWYDFKTKFYEKFVPEFFLKGKIQKFSITDTTPSITGGGAAPPIPSISFVPSASIGGMASTSFTLPVKPSVSVSKSVSVFNAPSSPTISVASASSPVISSIVKPKASAFIKSFSSGKSKILPSFTLSSVFAPSTSVSKSVFSSIPKQSISVSKPVIPSSVIASPPGYSSPSMFSTSFSSVSKTYKSISKSFVAVSPPVITPAYLPLKLGGRGTTGWKDWNVGKKYRYREFKVTDLKKLLGG